MGKEVTKLGPKFPEIIKVEKIKVAAYARVSTEKDEQHNSLEAQKDYFLKYIKNEPEWEYVGLYFDDGISGLSKKNRDGFNNLINDALDGRIDLIVTKSISRFARNTVDTISTIRKLKSKGIGVFFQKENINTLDSKGEFVLTLMSSFAQEESRSISENCTWGQRKRFADGKVSIPFARFLGYDRGENGELVVNEGEAKIVKYIYSLFILGFTLSEIKTALESFDIKSPGGTYSWNHRNIKSILTNEKYKGDALLQKSFTVDFLTKEKKKNKGEIPQYYVTGNHEAIIPPSTFDRVQRLLEQRKAGKNRISSVSIYSSKIKCGDCGSWYGSKTWHSTSKYRQRIWQCNHKFEEKCTTPHLTEEEIQDLFLQAINKLVKNKQEIISNHKEMAKIIFDTSALEMEKIELEEELNIVAEQVNDCINENARKVQNQDEYEVRYSSLVNRFNITKARLDEIKQTIIEKQSKYDEAQDFIKELEKQELMTEFDKNVWLSMVDYLTVHHYGKVEFTFLDGSQIELNR
ncbi:recombinase family protein [Streptococcus equi]|uniref:recombinase family protein n=1 Tax=Streptococcus equi TaxID=1336 RepID=UPI0013F5F0E4|nr:recombinase family protein [Streptococcus equi]MCD3391054.1 recombinase family protein [Streptococcus equi subsp. zooepidemicus]HEL1148966.1 recombinase family protein [Streptococcus equi subsp. zooepidemicus]